MEIKFDNNGRKTPMFKELRIGTIFSMCDFANGEGHISNLYIKTEENITTKETGKDVECNAVQLFTGLNASIAGSRLCRVWDGEIRVTDAKNVNDYIK